LIIIPLDRRLAIQLVDFSTKEEVEAFLVKTLPPATAGNPKYRGADGA
jgi:hypothetical protein